MVIQIAPFVNCVVTGAYWDKRYPRTLTNQQLKEIQQSQQMGIIKAGKMMSLADIVCDIKVSLQKNVIIGCTLTFNKKGAFECLSHSTSVDDGYFYYDAQKNEEHKK